LGGSRYANESPVRSVEEAVEGFHGTDRGGRGDRGRGRGRGGRGRGGGRGGRENGPPGPAKERQQTPQAPPKPSDFPELPANTKAASTKSPDANSKAPPALSFPKKATAQKAEETSESITQPQPEKKEKDKKSDEKDKQGKDIPKDKDGRPVVKTQPRFGFGSSTGERKSWADQVDDVTSPT